METVVVTGSRIPNRDISSDSPLVTVTADAIKATGAIEIQQTLNALPQVVASVSQGSNNPSGGGSESNFSSPGAQTVDLRGLGPNRTVVLMDGRRAAPSFSDGTVDLQTIPQAMISRIEVITGGTSAVYGPDAIAGVVNIITRTDFEGVEADAQAGVSAKGDDVQNAESILLGGNFADDKGNMVLSYDYAYRAPVFDSARSFSNQANTLTSRSPTGSFPHSTGNLVSQSAIDSYFAAHGGAPAGAVLNTDTLGFNPDGTLFDFGGASGPGGVFNYKGPANYPAKLFCADATTPSNCKSFSYNFQPPNLLSSPLQRQNIMASGHFAVTSSVEAYMQAKFTNYSSSLSLAPTPAPTTAVSATFDGGTGGVSGYVVPVNNPFIPSDLAALLATRTGPTPFKGTTTTGANADFLLVTRFLALGPRLQTNTNNAFSETGGLRGDLPWGLHFDAFATFGQQDTTGIYHGNVSNSAVEQLLFGHGTGECAFNNGFCDFDPFGPLKFGPKSLDYIQRVTKDTVHTTFTNVEADINGTAWDVPAGKTAFSLGADYREYTYQYLADPLLASGDVSGFTPGKSTQGAVYDKEVYGEFYLPLLKDAAWAESASMTFGGRLTEQAKTHHGNAWTWKAEGDWSIAYGVALRGSYEVATRMPNVSELFTSTFGNSPTYADPCNADGPFRNGPHAAQVLALCTAQGAGDPHFSQGSSQMTLNSGGNPNLTPETADTYTLGASWQSRFESPWLSNLIVTVDYWNIDLHAPIGVNLFGILYGCFNADGSNPTYSPSNANCQKLAAARSSSSITLNQHETNLFKTTLDGVDMTANWVIDLQETMGADPMWGDALTFNLSGTWLDTFIVQGSAAGKGADYAGTIGTASPVNIGLNTDDAFPKFKSQLTATWDLPQLNLELGTRIVYIDAMQNALSLVGWSGFPYGIGKVTGVPATFYVDLFGHYDITENIVMRAGVNNVLDQQPRLYNPSQQVSTDPALYDVIGRRYFIGVTAKFD
jgi:outer membrane receptor protein involved in Fe transport